MRAKQSILDNIAFYKSELEGLFFESVTALFGKNPPADLNLLAITATIPPKTKDEKAQRLINYFHLRMQQLIAMQQLIERVPDITQDIESGKLKKSISQSTDEIIRTLQTTITNLNENYQKSIKEYQTSMNSLSVAIEGLKRKVVMLHPHANNFVAEATTVTQELKEIRNSFDILQKEFSSTTAALMQDVASFNAPKGVHKSVIVTFLNRHPKELLQKQLAAINIKAPQIPVELSKKVETLSKSGEIQENFLTDTKKDLEERYKFYNEFNAHYSDAEAVAETEKFLQKNIETLKNNINRLDTSIGNIEKDLDKKRDINIQKELTEISKEVDESQIEIGPLFEKNYRELVREKLALLNTDFPKIKAIIDPDDRMAAFREVIRNVEKLITKFIDFKKTEIRELSAERIETYNTAVDEQVKDLTDFKKQYETLLSEFDQTITDTKEEYQLQSKELQTETAALLKKITEANDEISLLREQLTLRIRHDKDFFAEKSLVSLTEINEAMRDIQERSVTINEKFAILNAATDQHIHVAIPDLSRDIFKLQSEKENLDANFQKTIDEFFQEFVVKYKGTLRNIAGNDQTKITKIDNFNQQFLAKLTTFKGSLQTPTAMENVSAEDRKKYNNKIKKYLESREGLITSFFRNEILTDQKNIVGAMAFKYFQKLASAEQFLLLLDLLITWNRDLEAIAQKKYKLGMKSDLEKVLLEIKGDLESKFKPGPQITPGGS